MIASVDVFVIYDDMQYTKRDWRNRNLIKTSQGLKWLTIPVEVSGKYFQKIKDTKIADKEWNKKHWSLLEDHYKQAACFKEVADWLKPLYLTCDLEFLTDINILFLNVVMDYLNIKTALRMSSEFELVEERTERLVRICKQLGADYYVSGPSAKAYMNEQIFQDLGIDLSYTDYANYEEYAQLHPPFEHGVSILDMLFNLGKQTNTKMKLNG
jgi:hypothetical protein